MHFARNASRIFASMPASRRDAGARGQDGREDVVAGLDGRAGQRAEVEAVIAPLMSAGMSEDSEALQKRRKPKSE